MIETCYHLQRLSPTSYLDCKLATGTLTYMNGSNAYHILLLIHIK